MTKKVVGIAVAIIVCAALVPNLNAQWTQLLDEEFESSWSTGSPPAGWTITYGPFINTRDDWHRRYRAGDYCACIYYYYYTETDELISPVMDCSPYNEVWLVVDHYYSYYGGPYTTQWRGSTDGGSTFPHIIWDYYESSYGSYPFTRDSVEISSWAAGESQVAINFYADGYSWNMNYWYVDNVDVWAQAGEPPLEDTLDLKMVQIIRPKDLEEGGVAFTPECRIHNNLDTTAHAIVRCKIKDNKTMQTVYEDVLASFPCEPGYTMCSGFKYFTPEGDKKYNALFVLEHPDDVNPDNNHKSKDFSTAVGVDVTPFEILAPTEEQVNPFAPSARYAENAGAEETVANLICKIENTSYHAVVYADTIEMQTFAAYDTFTATFDEVSNLANGSYTITFWAEERDDNISNPPLVETFEYLGIAEEPVAERFSLDVAGSRISFSLPTATNVSLCVYDAAGKAVTTLVDGSRGPGSYTMNWNTSGVAAGVYFVRM
ncbi:MAG: hypothetical protein U9Q76_06835, partial [candidate division WOR-3 bacterium]|nr:hypothetical protein [candidate division WOR-3 bacterium]